jgi:hypothetical protein
MNSTVIPEGVKFVPPLFRRFKGGQPKKVYALRVATGD